MTEGQAGNAPNLQEQVDPILEQLKSGDQVESDALMVACQNLVTWASRFDSTRHGFDTLAPTNEDMKAAATALESLSMVISAYEKAMVGLETDLAKNHKHHRALSGYGCVKSIATHSQFVNRTI